MHLKQMSHEDGVCLSPQSTDTGSEGNCQHLQAIDNPPVLNIFTVTVNTKYMYMYLSITLKYHAIIM